MQEQQTTAAPRRMRDGFLERGAEMTRVETFVDAAFAFAVTLLVVGGGDTVPSSFEEFVLAMQRVPAFLACFANVMLFWYAHYRWSRRYGLEDVRSTMLSMALVFVVLIYVYPLVAVYSGAISFFTGGYLPSDFELESAQDLRTLFVVFGVGYAAMSAVIALLDAHALKLCDELALSDEEQFNTVTAIWSWCVGIGIAFGSVVIAVTAPDRFIVLAGMFYASFGVAMPILGITRHRLWKKRTGT